MSAGLSPLLTRAGLRYQTRHPWQLLLALVGIAMGVAVVLAVDMANDAAEAAFAQSAREIGGTATHRLVSRAGRLPERHYVDWFNRPDAPAMAPVVMAKVRSEAVDGRLRLLGLDAFAEGPFRGQLGSVVRDNTTLADWLTAPWATALSRSAADHLGVDVGDRLPVEYQGRRQDLEVVSVTDDNSLSSRDLLIVDIAAAQALTGWTGELSHIDLQLSDAQAATLPDTLDPSVEIVSIDDQLADTAGLSAAFRLNLTAMSLLALLVGVFLIFNAISFSVVQRRRLLGRLRALGVTRKEIARLILAEALVLAIVGSLLGTLLGAWLASGLTQIVAATISSLYYDVAAGALTWQPFTLAKAWVLGIGGTLAAAWLPARQAAATPPLTTLSRSALETSIRRRLPAIALAGAALVGLGLVIALTIPGGVVLGFAGLFLLLLGAAMIAPFALRGMHLLLRRLPWRGAARMAVRDIERHLSRLSTAGAALMVALAASVGVAIMVESMRGAVSDWLDALLTADVYIAAEAFEDGAVLPASVVARAPTIDGSAGFSSYRDRKLRLDGRRVYLIGAELAAQSRSGFDFLRADAARAWAGFDEGSVLISEPLSRHLGLEAGDPIELPTAVGPKNFAISGVFRDFASEHGRIFVGAPHYRMHWEDEDIETLALFAEPGLGTRALLDRVASTFADRDDLAFTLAREIYDESMRIFDRTFQITEVLRWLSILVAFIGVFSALMALQLERRKEYAVLRALGLTPAQVSSLIMLESVILGIVAALLAMPVGLAMAWILTAAIQLRAFGWSMPLTLETAPYVTALVTGAVAAMLASLFPAWRSARQNPAPWLRED
jgi:putative ABC transport system permease protein